MKKPLTQTSLEIEGSLSPQPQRTGSTGPHLLSTKNVDIKTNLNKKNAHRLAGVSILATQPEKLFL